MFTINLLPPLEKKQIRLEEIRRILLFFSISIAIVYTVALILLLPSYLPFYFERRELARLLTLEEGVSQKFDVVRTIEEVRKKKVLLESLRNSLNRKQHMSSLFEILFSTADPEVRLSAITIKEPGIVTMSGFARRRTALLAFEKKMRDNGTFQEIVLPLASVTRETDIYFSINARLKR